MHEEEFFLHLESNSCIRSFFTQHLVLVIYYSLVLLYFFSHEGFSDNLVEVRLPSMLN